MHELGRVPVLRGFADRALTRPRSFALNVSNVPGPSRPVAHNETGTAHARRNGTFDAPGLLSPHRSIVLEITMNGLIYLVGLIVVIMFVLSFLGLH